MSRLFLLMSITTGVLCAREIVSAATLQSQAHCDYVVLLHGMGRTALSMKRLEWYLTGQGYRVINVTYHSRTNSVEQLAQNYLAPILRERITDHSVKVHFVTHSLGGIIVREYLSKPVPENVGRVVMLGPPNHGSEVIDFLRGHRFTRLFLGASGRELGTTKSDIPNQLGPIKVDCGIIAGDRSLNPLSSHFLPGPNDGKVTVASAKLEGMRDFLVVHGTHTWMMWRKNNLQQIESFLRLGHFEHGAGNPI
jgi:pimeloyl-ACP methyl ester carboxylesterase